MMIYNLFVQLLMQNSFKKRASIDKRVKDNFRGGNINTKTKTHRTIVI